MKKIIILISALALWVSGYSQRTCGSELNMEYIRQTDPVRYRRIIAWESAVQQNLRSSMKYSSANKIIIPVVVHVVYSSTSQNISNAQIHSQIQVLNEDFQRRNADKEKTPPAFSNVAGSANIEFRLAKVDPNGNPTDGIIRTRTSVAVFTQDDNNVKSSSTGGSNAWNTRRYLNIWVCNLKAPLIGYAQFPFNFETSPNTDGVVIDYKYFGRDGSAMSPYNKGRTTTHEVGHWLDLRHIWGDKVGCSGTDYVSDTPDQEDKTLGCPSFPKTDHCTQVSPGVMFMNYMDYTNDACLNMFTKGQVERMLALFNSQNGIRKEMLLYADALTTPILAISGPTVVCSQGTYTIQDLPSGTSIQWSTSNGNLQLISGQGTRTAVFRKNGTGRCTIKAALRSANLNITPTLDVWAGVPKTTVSTSEYKDVTSATVELILNNPATIIDNMVSFSAQGSKIDPRNWALKNYNENILGLIRDGEYVTIIPLREGSGIFSMTALNDCGTGSPAYVTVNVVKRKLHLSLFPNPAADVATLKLTEGGDEILSPQGQGSTTRGVTSTYEIQLWNGLTMLRSFKTNQLTFQIPIAGLPAGLYFVRVIKDGQTYTEKLIKN